MRTSQLGVWPPLPPYVYLRHPAPRLPFPLEEPGHRLFRKGRQALYHGVRALALGDGDEVLMPAWHHGSEVEALLRAGITPRFYEGGPGLEPDADELEALLGPRVRALYLTHYLGFPQDAAGWLAWCRARRLLLLEDAAQGWLGSIGDRPLGSFGDLAIFCLYKTVALPDCGALISSRPPDPRFDGRASGWYRLCRRHAAWLISRSAVLAAVGVRLEGGRVPPEQEVALGDVHAPPFQAVDVLLPRLLNGDPLARRRANYRLLLAELAEHVPEPFARLPEGASPFAFPVEADDKPRLLERLKQQGISPLDFWAAPHPALPAERFPLSARLRGRIVGLPVHQELRHRDLTRIVTAVRGRPAGRAGELPVEVLDSLEPLRNQWAKLAERSQSIFKTWQWASTWWRHEGGNRQLEVAAVRRGDELIGIVPIYRWRSRPLKVLRFLGHGPADELGPICDPDDRAVVAQALRRVLGRLDWDVLVGEQLPRQQDWGMLLGGRRLAAESSPLLRFGPDGWEGFLRTRSANFREQAGRHARRLARDRRVRYRLTDGSRALQGELDTLFRLHAARWAGQPTNFLAYAAFHRAFAEVALEHGWLRLWFLEVDGEPVATLYGFRFAGSESYYQAGRDPRWSEYRVGFVLLAHAVRQAAEDGVLEYRLLRGGEDYKRRFATADPGLETIGLAHGPLAGAALPTLAAMRATPGPLGRLARRTGAGFLNRDAGR
jgi:CelD/BcsL family acetyltransferase involved in cellulose biosynthesis